MEYTYPQYIAFLGAASRAWMNELSDLTWSNFIGANVEGKKLAEILHSLKDT